ncbi:flagellar protein FlgN [bacterium]|nr:flagellar protein FlgN [bacterium]
MDKVQFHSLIEILDEEIRAYTNLKDLFAEKREILKKAKADDLGVLDNKIIALNNNIVELNKSRQELAMKMLGKDANMSEFIEYAENVAPEFAEPLKERKVKICKIIPEITLLNNQNVELLKHGIIISNKMLETIINAFAPQGSYYNGAGKTDTHDMDMWTISEEI